MRVAYPHDLVVDFHHLPNPAPTPHLNVKALFSERARLKKKCGLADAIAGLASGGTHHRGIDDARNIARMLPFVFGDARLPQEARA